MVKKFLFSHLYYYLILDNFFGKPAYEPFYEAHVTLDDLSLHSRGDVPLAGQAREARGVGQAVGASQRILNRTFCETRSASLNPGFVSSAGG